MGKFLSKSASDTVTVPSNESIMNNSVILSASGKHTSSLIFLHGLGDTGHGWASTLAEIRSDNMRIICPTAPTVPVTLNSGFQMPAWFDLKSLDPNGEEDVVGIKKSFDLVELLIKKEVDAGIAPENIVIGGFSQGGALALYTGFSTKYKIGGIVALSCWLPLHKDFPKASAADRTPTLPVLQCHGDCDPVVPFKWGQLTSTLLKKFLPKHEFKTFSGLGHSSSQDELDDIRTFLKEICSD